jgi:dipeptidyl-peptidase-3
MYALTNFLHKLEIYKATADLINGSKMYEEYSVVDDEHIHLRKIVIANKKPRLGYIQPTLYLDDGNVTYVRYENTIPDAIQSFVDKFD